MLAGSRTQIFALTEPLRKDTHAPTHMAFVLATAVAARRHDYDILLLTDEDAKAGMGRVAANGLVDAILVLDVAPDDERVKLARAISTPTIFIGVPDDHDGLVCVDLDFEAATALAVERLADAGHRAVGTHRAARGELREVELPAPRARGVRGACRRARSDGDVRRDRAPSTRAGRRRDAPWAAARGGSHARSSCTAPRKRTSSCWANSPNAGLPFPTDISLVSVGASFDTAALSTSARRDPAHPGGIVRPRGRRSRSGASSDLRPEPGLRLIDPSYAEHGSVAPPPDPVRREG